MVSIGIKDMGVAAVVAALTHGFWTAAEDVAFFWQRGQAADSTFSPAKQVGWAWWNVIDSLDEEY